MTYTPELRQEKSFRADFTEAERAYLTEKNLYQVNSIGMSALGVFGLPALATRMLDGPEAAVSGALQFGLAAADLTGNLAALRGMHVKQPTANVSVNQALETRIDLLGRKTTNRVFSSLDELNSLRGTGSNVGNLSDISGKNILDIVRSIPENAAVRVLKPVEGKSQAGLEYKWVDENGVTNRLRVHDPDPSHPGSNAANGWVARWQQKGGYYDPIAGDFAHKNAHKIDSPFYSPSAANNTHIPIETPKQWLIDLMASKK